MPHTSPDLPEAHVRNDIRTYRKCFDGPAAQTKRCIEQQTGRKYNFTDTLQQKLINRHIPNLPRPPPPGEVRYGRINRSRSAAVHKSIKDRQIQQKTIKETVETITTPCNFRYTKQVNMPRMQIPHTRHWVPYPDNDCIWCLDAQDGNEADPDLMRFFSEYMNSCMRLASYTSDCSAHRLILPPVKIPRCRTETPDVDLEDEVAIEDPKKTPHTSKTSKRHPNEGTGTRSYSRRSPRRCLSEKLERKPYLNGTSTRCLKSQLAFPISAYASSEECARAQHIRVDSDRESPCQSDDDLSDLDEWEIIDKDACNVTPQPTSKYLSEVLIRQVPISRRPDLIPSTEEEPPECSGEKQQPTNTTDETSVLPSGNTQEQSITPDRTQKTNLGSGPDKPRTSSSPRVLSPTQMLKAEKALLREKSSSSTRSDRVVPKLYLAKSKDIEHVQRLQDEPPCIELVMLGDAHVPVSRCGTPSRGTPSQCHNDQRVRSKSRETGNIDNNDEQLLKTLSKDSDIAKDKSSCVEQKSQRTLKVNTKVNQIRRQKASSAYCDCVERKSGQQVQEACSTKKSTDQTTCNKINNKVKNKTETNKDVVFFRRDVQSAKRPTTEETTLKSGKHTATAFMSRLRYLIETPSTRDVRVLKQGKRRRKLKKFGRNEESGIMPPIVEKTSIQSQRGSIKKSSTRSSVRESSIRESGVIESSVRESGGAEPVISSALDIIGREYTPSPSPRKLVPIYRKGPHFPEQIGNSQDGLPRPLVSPKPLQVSVDMRWIDVCSDNNVPATNCARIYDGNVPATNCARIYGGNEPATNCARIYGGNEPATNCARIYDGNEPATNCARIYGGNEQTRENTTPTKSNQNTTPMISQNLPAKKIDEETTTSK